MEQVKWGYNIVVDGGRGGGRAARAKGDELTRMNEFSLIDCILKSAEKLIHI